MIRHRPGSLSILVLCALVSLGLAAPVLAGSIFGRVLFSDEIPAEGTGPFRPVDMTDFPHCEGKYEKPMTNGTLVLGKRKGLSNVFVRIRNAPAGRYNAPRKAEVIDQTGCVCVPRVVGVRVDQPLVFRNSDRIHYSLEGLPSKNPRFNFEMPPTLAERVIRFDKAELSPFVIRDKRHPWRVAFVAVMTHPFFDVTRETGWFKIRNVPDGEYVIEAWHETLGTRRATVTIDEDSDAKIDFRFEIPDAKAG